MRQRRISLNDNIPLLKPLNDILSRAPRMNLILSNVDVPTAPFLDVLLQFL
jgi:hypothetical protein